VDNELVINEKKCIGLGSVGSYDHLHDLFLWYFRNVVNKFPGIRRIGNTKRECKFIGLD